MLALQKCLSWLHVLSALVCLRIAILDFLALKSPARLIMYPRLTLGALMMVVLSAVFGAAWWTAIKAKPSARAWGLSASSLYISAVLLCVLLSHSVAAANPLLILIGVLSFIAWVKPLKVRLAARFDENVSLRGDFTSQYVNRAAQAVTFGLSLGAFFWWQRWLRVQHIQAFEGIWIRSALTLIVLLSITSIHELGHAGVGLLCGMKLRAFFIGPLQWRIRDAKWEFEFKPKGLFLADGLTALIPGSGELERWQYLSMMGAGALVNLLAATIALFTVLFAGAALPPHASAFLALFGLWSLSLAAGNLLPFRTPQGYSDGAIVLQLLSGGAFADFHLSVARIGSSMVSPLRPRDYDIRSIRRAAQGISEGRQALLLWLYAFSHSLDSGKLQEADDVLAKAEFVCLQSASNIPAELHTSFVFGNALVRRDAKTARFWWNRMQSKSPKQFNADYWRAQSALYWIEGNLSEARSAWAKSNALALQMPHAGAYDFSRDCCNLLRRELDRALAA